MIDWIATILLITGLFFAGKKYWWAWIITISSEILWIIVGFQNNIDGLIITNVIIIILNIYNCVSWYKEKNN